MPQPVSYNPGTPISGSIQENSISYVVDGQQRDYRGGFGGLSWMSEVPAENNVIFIGNTTSIGRGPAGKPLFYPSYNNTEANIVYAANTLPGSPRNFTTSASAYNWAVTNNFFINNSDNPIPRIDADGLVFYTDARQASSYPQTGTSWYDLSGNNNIFGLFNGPSFNPNGYITTDGVDDSLSSTNPQSVSNISGSDPFTFSALFKLTQYANQRLSDSANFTSLLMKGSYNPSFGISLWYDLPSGGVFTRARTYSGIRNLSLPTTASGYGNPTQTSNTNFALNRWYQVDFTSEFSGTTYTFKTYINGNLDVTSTPTDSRYPVAFQNNSNLTVASSPLGGNGITAPINIAKTAIYKKTLSQAEINQNYYQAPIVTDGLVLAVDAGNLVSYENGSTTTYSLTGSISGSLINGVGYLPNNGGAWSFDGTDDYITLGTQTLVTNDFSLNIWFNSTSNVAKEHFIISFGYSSNPSFLITQNTQDNGQCNLLAYYVANGVGTGRTINNSPFPNTSLINLSFVRQNGVNTAYINGVPQTSRIFTENITFGSLTYVLGWAIPRNKASAYMQGNIYNCSIYNRALSASEVFQNYEATKDKFQGQQIVTNGLVLNLDAADKDSYPGTGTTWTDLSGNGNNGTLTNGPLFLSNVNGGTVSFDGVDDFVLATGNPTLQPASTITLEAIFQRDGGRSIVNYGTDSGGASKIYSFEQPSNASLFLAKVVTTVTGQVTLNGPILATGTWYHVVMTYNGSTAVLYINGSSYTSLAASGNINYPAGSNLNLGRKNIADGEYISGKISVCRVYNRALSATEVLQNFNAQKVRFGL